MHVIVKMKFLSITGPKEDIDRVVNKYLAKYEIHLENALAQLTQVQHLTPYIQINPYREVLNKATGFTELLGNTDDIPIEDISVEDAIKLVQDMEEKLTGLNSKRAGLEEKRSALEASMERIEPFQELPYDISSVIHFNFVQSRFGKIGKEFYSNFENYVYENLDAVFYPCHSDDEYVWGVYFAPRTTIAKVDAVFSSMHFEKVFIPDQYQGTPSQAYNALDEKYQEIKKEIQSCKMEITQVLQKEAIRLISAQDRLAALSTNFDVRKVAACTAADLDTFYILCGWMAENDAEAFQKEIENDMNLFCIIEDDQNNIHCQPPTKLKNPKPFRPFEMFVRMYGLPAYNEIDPTIFVAVTYAFIFGAMFGDAGQGLCLVAGGFLLYKFKKLNLAAIIGTAGIFSTFFGFMFGSVFGFEDLIPAVWLRPVKSMTQLPLIGNLNTVFVVAIAFGMFLVVVTMIFHIINGIKAKDTENIWFDTNAVAGLVFYAAIILTIGLFLTGNKLPGAIVLVIMFVVPLLVIAMKEPLTKLVEKKSKIFPEEKGMFIAQSFFELFEVLLSYFSNTLSFVRIGAFAVSHAAMMEVVLMLAGAEAGSPNWIVVVIGNIIVCGMEGLIVGIQVLRLEYYELFSRFYKGTGKEFIPFLYRSKKTKTAK